MDILLHKPIFLSLQLSRFLSFSKFFLTAKLDNYSNKILGYTDWSQLGGRDLTCADAAAWEALKARAHGTRLELTTLLELLQTVSGGVKP